MNKIGKKTRIAGKKNRCEKIAKRLSHINYTNDNSSAKFIHTVHNIYASTPQTQTHNYMHMPTIIQSKQCYSIS